MLYVALAFRVAGIIDLVTWLPVDSEPRWLTLTLMGLLALESTGVFLVYLQRRAIGPTWLVVCDAVFIVGAMFVDLSVTANVVDHHWGFWIRNFAIGSLVGIAIGLRRWWGALAAISAVAGTYWMCTTLVGGYDEYMYYRFLNCLTDGGGGFAVAYFLRPRAAAMDEALSRAVAAEALLARERDRAARAALLHDEVLQTLEMLAQGTNVSDPELRRHVAARAHWLRQFVRGENETLTGGLGTVLYKVIEDVAHTYNLQVDLHGGQIEPPVSPAAIGAVADGLREALANVAKHSGAGRAVVRFESADDQFHVSVVDHGRGFRIDDRHCETGLHRSIRRRMSDVGGWAAIRSEPGAGTQVEFCVPLPPRRSPQPASPGFGAAR
ncbi:MAG TPA: ATP-binding protein [Amycolatopsis sp.]|nr:ATP-binding protein [Amycolatopsis sp.]